MKYARGPCETFRALLEEKLACGGCVQDPRLGALSWHEHLLGCEACRELLAEEQALEVLLATLPEPRLPRELAERLLVRLRAARVSRAELDALLELDRALRAPEGLAARVLARLAPRVIAPGIDERPEPRPAALESTRALSPDPTRAAADVQLEALLDRDRTIEVPSGLARRVLGALHDERALEAAPATTPVALRATAGSRSRWIYASAAGLLVALGVAWWSSRSGARSKEPAPIGDGRRSAEGQDPRAVAESRLAPQRGGQTTDVARLVHPAAPDAQMLAALGVLEQWDLLMQEDVDVLLSTLDPAEQILLEDEAEVPALPVPAKEAEQPSKG